ncbi:MAG: hypothetical protein JWL87_506 [Candidatus Adlerbacteria bacterium]|nr:hypothetical protein [Candidatus Adlerbacteria bacterium]
MDRPLLVKLLAEYAKEESVTRPEVGRIVGMTLGAIAGIHNRYKKEIGPWPHLDKNRKKNRGCQFPIGVPGTTKFHLCGNKLSESQKLVCTEHEDVIWKPPVD